MFKISIIDSSGKIWKTKMYHSQKAFNIWSPKMFKKFTLLGNIVESYKIIGSGSELIERKGRQYGI